MKNDNAVTVDILKELTIIRVVLCDKAMQLLLDHRPIFDKGIIPGNQ